MKENSTLLIAPSEEGITRNKIMYGKPSLFRHKKVLAALLLACLFSVSTYAQITAGFELDGNAHAVVPNPPDDWSMVYSGTSNAQVSTGVIIDQPNGNDNAFQQGSSDLNDIPTWHWTLFSTPDKDDLLHGGAVLYNNDKIYFFGDRYATNGSAQMGFWLFKNAVYPNSDGTFTGQHAVGDVLLLSDFVNGGGTPVIKAYKWVGSGGSDGSLDLLGVTGSDLFAIVNSSSQPSPWPYVPKFGPVNIFGPGGLFEGGIDLAAFSVSVDPCFTSFILETRSSHSLSAELKDFIFGNFYTAPQVSVNSATLCPGAGPTTLTATVTGGVGPFSYLWSNGATSSSITVSPSSTTTYSVTVTAANGCVVGPATGTVTVNSPPPCSIGNISPGNLICNHGNYTISTSVSSGTLSWSMTVDGNPPGWGIVGSNTGQTITFSSGNCGPPGFLVHFTLTVTDGDGCTSTCTADFAPGAPICIVQIAPPIELTCAVTSQYLLASYTTDILNPQFEWTLGATSLGQGILDTAAMLDSILITAPGTYTFTIIDTSNSANNCFASVTVTQDTTSPGASATGGELTCTDTTVQLTASSPTDSVTFSWTGPAGFSSSLQNPTVNVPGNYTVTVTDSTNGCTSTAVAVVTIDTVPPGAQATGGELTCVVTSIQLMATATATDVSFSWTGPGGFSSSQQNPTVSVPGNYDVTVTDSSNGCTSTATAIVTQDTIAPGAQATGGNLTCDTTSVQLTATSTATDVSFSWTGPGGFSSSQQNPTVSVPGNYDVTVTDSSSGCTSTATAIVTQDTLAPGVQATGGDLTCVVISVQLTATSSATGISFSWTGPGGFSSSQQNPTVSVPGNYDVTVTDSSSGCTSTATAIVTQDTIAPGAQAIGGNLTCVATTVQLMATATATDVSFSWTGPGGFSSSQQNPTVSVPGNYDVTVTDSSSGCTSSATAVVTQDTIAPTCNINAPANMPPCDSTGFTLTVTATTGVTYSWSVSGTGWAIVGSTTDSTITYSTGSGTSGTFTVVVTDPGNGCTSSCTITLTCVPDSAEGCTPGYWKNHTFQWNQASDAVSTCIANAISSLGAPYSGNGTTGSLFSATFGVTAADLTAAGYTNPNMTLQQAISSGGGGFFKLARHGVAALLNTCANLSGYPYTTTQVLTDIHNAILNLTPEPLASQLAAANEGTCPLGNSMLRPVNPGNPIALTAFPNPFNSTLTIQFMLDSDSENANVEIYSSTGAKVATVFNGPATAGEVYTVNLAADSYATGIYFCRITANDSFFNLKLMLAKE
jgi:predicted lipoprotein